MSNEKLREWLLSMPLEVRSQVVQEATGSKLGYLHKRMYQASPTFKIRIAVGLDKASGGQLDFREMVQGAETIDWTYVRDRLQKLDLT